MQNSWFSEKIVRSVFFSIASFAIIAGLVSLSKGVGIRAYSDTYAYIEMANRGYMDLIALMRPYFSVALFKLVSSDHQSYVKLQHVVYIAGWLWLLYAVAMSVRKALFVAPLCAVIVYFALNPLFSLWTNALLTEAISIAAMAMLAGFFIMYQRSGRTLHLAGAGIVLVFLAHYKDVAAYYALLWIAPFVLLAIAKNFPLKPAFVFAGVVTCAALFSFWTAEHVGEEAHETRWYFSMLNNIGKRVLTNDQFTAFYSAHGMPVSPALLEFRGNYGSDQAFKVYKRDDLKDFREWLRKDGKTVYAKLLLSYPLYAIAPLFSTDDDIFQNNFRWLEWYVPPGFNLKTIAQPDFSLLFFFNLSVCIFIAVRACQNRTKESALTALAAFSILLIAPVIGLLAYHADAMEVTRHELPTLAHVALSTVILLALGINLLPNKTATLSWAAVFSLMASAGVFYLISSQAYHAQWASTKFHAPSTSYTWNGCMLPTAVGRSNDKCEMIKAAPYRSGHLTFGPYEPLPSGTYRAELGYSSGEKEIAGDWDVAVSYLDNTNIAVKGLLRGTQGAQGKATGNFTVRGGTSMGKVEIHSFSHHHLDLQINYLRLTRVE